MDGSPVGDLESSTRNASNHPHQIDTILPPSHQDHRHKELTQALEPSIFTRSRSPPFLLAGEIAVASKMSPVADFLELKPLLLPSHRRRASLAIAITSALSRPHDHFSIITTSRSLGFVTCGLCRPHDLTDLVRLLALQRSKLKSLGLRRLRTSEATKQWKLTEHGDRHPPGAQRSITCEPHRRAGEIQGFVESSLVVVAILRHCR
ncbi:hypothetical protein TIFTF001_009087 [Ficus carica]|uniref:Uncharacterized protein n=1 Tax=Ficus carica TaxID=3494 RepID=A0AA87ZU45_FICCA|nr:hypothetical protein TIFTF001_009087 [Ficus carica]